MYFGFRGWSKLFERPLDETGYLVAGALLIGVALLVYFGREILWALFGKTFFEVSRQGLKIRKEFLFLSTRKFIDYRQLAVIDIKGRSASFTGAETLGTNAVVRSDGCIAAGNLLISTEVPQAMTDSFSNNSNLHLTERLLLALQAGLDAGGEEGPVHSAGIKVAHEHPCTFCEIHFKERLLMSICSTYSKYIKGKATSAPSVV